MPPPYPNPANRRPPADRARRAAWSWVFWGLGCIAIAALATLFSYQQAKDALQYTSSDYGIDGARVQHLDDRNLNERRVWPAGYTVLPDSVDPTRGMLVRAEDAS